MTTADADATRILGKGPEYLRKQMELESDTKGRVSAVERLAASKPKYVKSQQVVNSTQEPVISFGAPSVSSNGSSNRSSTRSGNYVTGNTNRSDAQSGPLTPLEEDNMARRTSSKKRDSLLLYRQKCDLLKGSSGEKNKRNLGRRLLLTSLIKANSLPEATGKECESEDGHTSKELKNDSKTATSEQCALVTLDVSTGQGVDIKNLVQKEASGIAGRLAHNRITEVKRRSGKGVGRSHSDISSRYSKNFADFDAFFKYCGLCSEIIESLGKENFSALSDKTANKIRSVSCSTSDGGFSQNSGESDGLQQEELHENIRQETSVIERNARIIKWLYSCKNAQESGKTLRDLE
ncbi:protein FAM110C [Osmerus eperlanus]|uniref:protein FAM110C n=1 Tax=Osmerus eperlanus TaxID=29151 RepID=UPI002E0EB192